MTVKRIVIATVGYGGLEDHVSGEFGHSRTFTIVEVEDGVVRDVKVIGNPAGPMTHGRGPVVAKRISDMGVEVVISGELGPGASMILQELGISRIIVKPGFKVVDVLKEKGFIK